MSDHLDISQEVIDFFTDLDEPNQEASSDDAVTSGQASEEQILQAIEEVESEEGAEQAPSKEVEGEPQEEEAEGNETDQEEASDQPEQTEYQKWQSIKDREIADLRQTFEQQIAQLTHALNQQAQWNQQMYQEQVSAHQAQTRQQNTQVTAQDLSDAVDRDLRGTFQWVAVNRPDLVPYVTGIVREKEQYGHAVADTMMSEWTSYQLAQQQAMFEAQRAEQLAPQQAEATMGQIISNLEQKHGESFSNLREDIESRAVEAAPSFREYMNSNGYEITPQAVADFISQVYFDVREAKLSEQANKPRGPQKLTPQQHVENPGAEGRQEVTADELAMNELLQGAKALGIDISAAS